MNKLLIAALFGLAITQSAFATMINRDVVACTIKAPTRCVTLKKNTLVLFEATNGVQTAIKELDNHGRGPLLVLPANAVNDGESEAVEEAPAVGSAAMLRRDQKICTVNKPVECLDAKAGTKVTFYKLEPAHSAHNEGNRLGVMFKLGGKIWDTSRDQIDLGD
jgi:hypothetical protein